MSAPPQAAVALAWAVVGPPLVILTLMTVSIVIEVLVVIGFSFLMAPSPRRPALVALPFFKIHLTFAVTTLVGIAWQLASRATPRLRWLHRHTGPYVVLTWALALITGIYNYVFLYLMGSR